MKIGIIGALKKEIIPFRNVIKNYKISYLNQYIIYIGQLVGKDVFLLESGVGKVSAALNTEALLTIYKPDIIINIGSAGGILPTLKIGEIIVSSETCYHDVDVTAFGYRLGQLPGYPLTFKADEKLIAVSKKCIKQLNLNAIYGLIVTGDVFINDFTNLSKIRLNFPSAIAVEMEATAIAHVCYNFNVPFIVIREISDMANQQSQKKFNEFLINDSRKLTLIVKKMIQRFNQN